MRNKNMKLGLLSIFSLGLILGISSIVSADTTGDSGTGTVMSGSIESGDEQTTLPQIMIDEETNTIYITGGNINTGDMDTGVVMDMTGTVESGDIEDEIIEMPDLAVLTPEEEFAAALAWMYENGLTMYNNTGDYRPNDPLTREEASKIIGQAYSVLGYSDVDKNTSCMFSDAAMFNPTLAPHIAKVCKRGLFKGSDGKFMPQDSLTKAQSMAVLMRMFEGKMSYEQQNPWREKYYQKGKIIGLTNVEDINKFDHELTRYEIALMIYRLKNLVENEQLKTIALNAIGVVTLNTENTIASGTINPETVTDNLETLVGGINPNADPELLAAIYWMYDNGLTIHDNATDYKPFDTLNRVGAAKIFDKFSNMLGLGVSEAYLPNECEFTDIEDLDTASQAHIVNVCKKGLIKGGDGFFTPDAMMNKSQFIVALIRMFEGKHLDENVTPRWNNYFEEAKELGLVAPGDALTFDTPISRYEVALFLYKFDIKYKMLNNLNNNRILNEIISTVGGSISTGLDGKYKANVYVDANLLRNSDFDIGYIEIFGTRYKTVKSSEETYFTDNFVRYGDIFDMVTDELIGSINFLVSNGYVIESIIRFTDGKDYEISGVEGTNAYYEISEK